ncbi:MAG: tetratricopeptide repeat protein [Candidatus Cloacimonetes bacterium]|nr:tetratricopeptide repeat protein [Candidatus Cloacimonadota bacterium]
MRILCHIFCVLLVSSILYSNDLAIDNFVVPQKTWKDVYSTNLEIKTKIHRLFQSKKYKDCIELIRFYLDDRDGQASHRDLFYKRAYSYFQLKKYDKSLFYFDELLKSYPDFRDGWYNRGSLLEAMSRANEALSSYDKAIEINSGTWWIHYDRAVLLIKMKKDLMAMIALKKVLALRENNAWAHFELGNITYRQKKYVNALKYYLKAKSINSKIAGLNTRINYCKKRIIQD